MEKTLSITRQSKIQRYRPGDPQSAFAEMSPGQILDTHGSPRSLLSSSLKAEKCLSVGVLTRILFLTPGVFCPHATAGCLAACLGHSSGRMQMPTHALARDRRTALYIEAPELFMEMLSLEIGLLKHDARRLGLRPAVRLNGSSDLPWETLRPDIFRRFPDVQFFDYTKHPSRMNGFLGSTEWPANYYLTFSAQPTNRDESRRVLNRGGTVAVVFWPQIPSSFHGFTVVDGDEHDARFLDPAGTIVGLTAKGLARADLTGFTVRLCPNCGSSARELELQPASVEHPHTIIHRCRRCHFTTQQRLPLPHAAPSLSTAA